jgi:hydrophobic/amphiphilic exporter-1 (mainly G- bacteria), HAE1 family
VPQVFVKVDRDKVLKQGVDLAQVYQTLQTFMGGFFVNYFNRFGRQWQVYVEAEGDYRTDAKNVGQFYVRNGNNEMVPLDAITAIEQISGPEFTMRYNEYRSAQINGAAASGYSSAQATKALEETFRQTMPPEMGLRLPRNVVPGKEGAGRRACLGCVWHVTALCLPDSRRTL